MLPDECAISVSGLTKNYGSSQALRGLDLKVARSSIYGIIGPNGAGKTTLLKIIAGIIRPTAGDVKVLGHQPNDKAEKLKASIGYLPEKPSAYDVLTVHEFWGFIKELYSIPDDLFGERVKEYSKTLGLGDYGHFYIGALSKGLLQRALLVSIFIHEPQLYLLDEPFSGLDPTGIWRLRMLLREKAKSGATVLIATHMLDLVEKLCDRIAVINQGQIVVEGSPQGLRETAGTESSLEVAYLRIIGDEP